MKLIRVSHPAVEPVTLGEAKAHLNLDLSEADQDDLLRALLSVARESAESYCNRAFASASYALLLDAFPAGAIALPPDVTAITSLTYLDSDSAAQTLAGAAYSLKAERGELRAVTAWPVGYDVRLEFVAGGTLVPPSVLAAIKLIVGDLYENREGQFVGVNCAENKTVKALLDPFRVGMGV